MIDSLFDKKTKKQFDTIASKIAKWKNESEILAKKSLRNISRTTIEEVFDSIKKHGHPNEVDKAEELQQKYLDPKQFLNFDDLLDLDNLYQATFQKISNKDSADE